ncbi:MAG: 50S ribosomal protein L23 [bacterium]|nr:50S ribosomal protein L23 [Candidatus Sumerlaeota bacterium]
MKSPYVILDRPLITERATILADRKDLPQYVFKVAVDANKIEIRRAVEKAFNVKVKSVNTILFKGKMKRLGRSHGRRSDWKKAFVILEKGQKLDQI